MIDLFGNIVPVRRVERRKDDYDGFVEKFKLKKTTDDCYTPPAVYDCVLSWLKKQVDISGCDILRPFYPGGDYRRVDYPANSVVVDNPPFSIISKIARFYTERNIRFFLWAPHLTLFGAMSDLECTAVVCGRTVTYENGAKVNTSFLTNMLPSRIKIIGVPELYKRLGKVEAANLVSLPKYVYPNNVLTVTMIDKLTRAGISIQLDKDSVSRCGGLDDQKPHKKAIFGSGFLLSEKAAAEKAAAEKAAAEKAAAEKANVIEWRLSDREINIIKNLK